MEVFEAVMARHSVRDFNPDPVPKAAIMKILEAAVHAPSTVNSQPWNIYVAGGAMIEIIRKAYIARGLKRGQAKLRCCYNFVCPTSHSNGRPHDQNVKRAHETDGA